MRRRLPELQDELQSLLQKTEEALRQLPKPPSNDAFAEILHLVSDFGRDMARHLEGTPEGHGLLQTLRPVQERFKKAIRETAPDFRPIVNPRSAEVDNWADSGDASGKERSRFSQPDFLRAEEPDAWSAKDDERAIYVDEVMQRARQ